MADRRRSASLKRWLAAFLAGAAVLLGCATARAGSPTEELRGFFGRAARILDPATEMRLDERFAAVRTMVRGIVDFREAARLSLGPSWSARTPVEREEFVALFADLLERSLIGGIAARTRPADGVQVSYLGESIDGPLAVVRTTIHSRRGLELPFDYWMIARGDHWAVRDVVIDGVSVAANYRAQFSRLLQSSSYAELITQLRARVLGGPAAALAAVGADAGEPPIRLPSLDVAQAPSNLEPPRATVESPASPRVDPPPSPRREPEPASSVRRPPEPSPSPRSQIDAPSPVRRPAEPSPPARGPLDSAPPSRRQSEPPQLARLTPEPQVARVATRPPQPARAIPPTRTAPAANAKTYWVQVGAFKSPEAAGRVMSALRPRESAVASRCESSSGDLVRVRVGPFGQRADALAKLFELEAQGYRSFVAEEREGHAEPQRCG